MLNDVDGLQVGVGSAQHPHDWLDGAVAARRADLRLTLAVNEDDVGMGREVPNRDLDVGHGSIVALSAVGDTGVVRGKTLNIRAITVVLAILATSALAYAANPAVHTFIVWGNRNDTQKLANSEKFAMYMGWSNGYFSGRGAPAFSLRTCIEDHIPYSQAIAMIDKYHDGHPERWGIDLSDGIVQALTVAGSPCSGKAP
jgi:hypothetical protein